MSGVAACISMKTFRQQENRSFRHTTKQRVTIGDYDRMPHSKEYQNEWVSPRDVKSWFGNLLKTSYKCWFCKNPDYMSGTRFNKCHCAEFKEHYKELMRK